MAEPKFDLEQMLREIEEDEEVSPHTAKQITQDEIRARVLRKRKGKQDG